MTSENLVVNALPKGWRDGQATKATPDDLPALRALESQFPEADRISPRSWRRFIAKPNAVFVWRVDGEVVGAAVLLFRHGSKSARLYSIAVDPARRGQGIGPSLLTACEASACASGANAMSLEVRVSNGAAIALYRKSGFAETKRLAAYYDDGEDALRMQKSLNCGAESHD